MEQPIARIRRTADPARAGRQEQQRNDDQSGTDERDMPGFSMALRSRPLVQAHARGSQLGQRSCTAPKGRTHDRFPRHVVTLRILPPRGRPHMMSVGDRVRVWNGGQSWPGQIDALPGDGTVVIQGGPRWTGYRAIVPRGRMYRSASAEQYECRLTIVCTPKGAGYATVLDPIPVTMTGVTLVTPRGTVLPLSPCFDSVD